jgi:hypothetical protein
MDSAGTEITQLLNQLRVGDRSVEARLLEQVYPELHRLAEQCWRDERLDHTLQPTALINEAYMLLAGQWNKDWSNRAHFFGVAARIMRRVAGRSCPDASRHEARRHAPEGFYRRNTAGVAGPFG